MKKDKIKKCPYYTGIEFWKNKKRQKKDIDKQKESEAFIKIMKMIGR